LRGKFGADAKAGTENSTTAINGFQICLPGKIAELPAAARIDIL